MTLEYKICKSETLDDPDVHVEIRASILTEYTLRISQPGHEGEYGFSVYSRHGTEKEAEEWIHSESYRLIEILRRKGL